MRYTGEGTAPSSRKLGQGRAKKRMPGREEDGAKPQTQGPVQWSGGPSSIRGSMGRGGRCSYGHWALTEVLIEEGEGGHIAGQAEELGQAH